MCSNYTGFTYLTLLLSGPRPLPMETDPKLLCVNLLLKDQSSLLKGTDKYYLYYSSLGDFFSSINTVPKPLSVNAVPKPLSVNAVPKPLSVNAVPKPLSVNAVPKPLSVNAVLKPLSVDTVPKLYFP